MPGTPIIPFINLPKIIDLDTAHGKIFTVDSGWAVSLVSLKSRIEVSACQQTSLAQASLALQSILWQPHGQIVYEHSTVLILIAGKPGSFSIAFLLFDENGKAMPVSEADGDKVLDGVFTLNIIDPAHVVPVMHGTDGMNRLGQEAWIPVIRSSLLADSYPG